MLWILLTALVSGDMVCDEETSDSMQDNFTSVIPTQLSCGELVEMLYLSRGKVVKEIRLMAAEMDTDDFPMTEAQQRVSRTHALLLSQLHVASVLFQAKGSGCLTEQLKFIFVAGIRKTQSVEEERWKFLFNPQMEFARNFVIKVAELFETETKALGVFLRMDIPNEEISDLHYTHENDGRLTTLEALRRATFFEDIVDTEFLKNFHNMMWSLGETSTVKIADFGAGSGRYAEILRAIGNFEIVDAFDGTDDVDILTRGKVRHANFLTPGIFIGKLYHWTLAIRVFDQLENHENFLKALDRHSINGTIITWSSPDTSNAVISPKTREEVILLFEKSTNFRFNKSLTENIQQNAALVDELFVFTKH